MIHDWLVEGCLRCRMISLPCWMFVLAVSACVEGGYYQSMTDVWMSMLLTAITQAGHLFVWN